MAPTSPPTNTPVGATATFAATIPANAVTTAGVQYYVTASDGFTSAAEPGTAYIGDYVVANGQQIDSFPVHVLEPPHVVHVPTVATTSGNTIPLTASANCATQLCSATISWQIPGQAVQSQAMTGMAGQAGSPVGVLWSFAGAIPASSVTPLGLQYQITVTDGYVTDTTPWIPVTVPM
jgi:hypothetical protein